MIEIRPFKVEDIDNGFLETLTALSPTYKPCAKAYLHACEREFNDHNYLMPKMLTVVAFDTVKQKVVGTASLLIERKLIRNGGIAGHLEDVAVHDDHQGQGIGASLVEYLVESAREDNCYKIVLNCEPKTVSFYEKCGFTKTTDVFMRMSLYKESEHAVP